MNVHTINLNDDKVHFFSLQFKLSYSLHSLFVLSVFLLQFSDALLIASKLLPFFGIDVPSVNYYRISHIKYKHCKHNLRTRSSCVCRTLYVHSCLWCVTRTCDCMYMSVYSIIHKLVYVTILVFTV